VRYIFLFDQTIDFFSDHRTQAYMGGTDGGNPPR
jgi:hypothetical protein